MHEGLAAPTERAGVTITLPSGGPTSGTRAVEAAGWLGLRRLSEVKSTLDPGKQRGEGCHVSDLTHFPTLERVSSWHRESCHFCWVNPVFLEWRGWAGRPRCLLLLKPEDGPQGLPQWRRKTGSCLLLHRRGQPVERGGSGQTVSCQSCVGTLHFPLTRLELGLHSEGVHSLLLEWGLGRVGEARR